ncbi:MAG: VTT domain-containing protein [Schleiferiaceae bacterium]
MSPVKKIIRKGQVYHVYYRRSGGYRFLGQNMWRLLIGLGIFGLAVWLLNAYVFDITKVTDYITQTLPTWLVLATLLASESFTGLLPPDVYILWAKGFDYPFLMVFVLAFISYSGGVISYFIGTQLHRLPKIHQWVDFTFKQQFDTIRKFGGLLIFIAALTPLPFSPVSVVAGVVDFPFKTYLLVALSRFLRFFLYATVIFQMV